MVFTYYLNGVCLSLGASSSSSGQPSDARADGATRLTSPATVVFSVQRRTWSPSRRASKNSYETGGYPATPSAPCSNGACPRSVAHEHAALPAEHHSTRVTLVPPPKDQRQQRHA